MCNCVYFMNILSGSQIIEYQLCRRDNIDTAITAIQFLLFELLDPSCDVGDAGVGADLSSLFASTLSL